MNRLGLVQGLEAMSEFLSLSLPLSLQGHNLYSLALPPSAMK
jgi:hypothetical protein